MLSRQNEEPLGQMENRDWTGLDSGVIFFRVVGGWGGGGLYYFFLVCKKISFSTFPQQAIFFSFFGEGVGKGEVLYRLYSSLLFVGFVLCLSFLVWVGGLVWSLCLTHGRHVSLES